MFTPLPGHSVLAIAPEGIIAVIESINTPNIAIPEVAIERTKAWLVGCLTPNGGASIFCYLLLLDTNRPILYMANPTEVPLEQYSWLENESIHFVESMGFMLDNLSFRAREPQEQLAMLESFPFLREQQQRLAGSLPTSNAAMVLPPDEIPPQRMAVARLLASF